MIPWLINKTPIELLHNWGQIIDPSSMTLAVFYEDCDRFIVKVLSVFTVGLKVNCFDRLDYNHERRKWQRFEIDLMFSWNAIESITSVFFVIYCEDIYDEN